MNPVRPAVLLREIRDLFLGLAGVDEPREDDAIQIFRMLLQIDAVAGDTKARDKIASELEKARAEGRDRDAAALEQVLA